MIVNGCWFPQIMIRGWKSIWEEVKYILPGKDSIWQRDARCFFVSSHGWVPMDDKTLPFLVQHFPLEITPKTSDGQLMQHHRSELSFDFKKCLLYLIFQPMSHMGKGQMFDQTWPKQKSSQAVLNFFQRCFMILRKCRIPLYNRQVGMALKVFPENVFQFRPLKVHQTFRAELRQCVHTLIATLW